MTIQRYAFGLKRDLGRDEWFRDHGTRVLHIRNPDVRHFQFDDLFASDRNGPVIETDNE